MKNEPSNFEKYQISKQCEADEQDREAIEDGMIAKVQIDDEVRYVTEVHTDHYYLPQIETNESEEFVIAKDDETATEATREYWKDMALNDSDEFIAIAGADRITSMFAAGQTLDDWIDLVLQDGNAHQWASYDGNEYTLKVLAVYNEDEWDKVGIGPEDENALAFRHN